MLEQECQIKCITMTYPYHLFFLERLCKNRMVSSREEPMLEKGADKREGDVFLFLKFFP
jgi:hypothetical protein